MTSLTQYFGTNHYTSSSGTPSGSSAPMDIGAANTRPQHGKGIQCYNFQGFGHISRKCTSLDGPGNKGHNKDGLYSPR